MHTGPELATIGFATGDDGVGGGAGKETTMESLPACDLTLLWLPGSGQRADNEILRRLVNALHSVGLRMHVIGLEGPGDVQDVIAAVVEKGETNGRTNTQHATRAVQHSTQTRADSTLVLKIR